MTEPGLEQSTTAHTQWARDAYAKAKQQHPGLTSYGFDLPRGTDYLDDWAEGISTKHALEIHRAACWLDGMETVKHPDRFGSCGLKHSAERWAGAYVREGALIVAALALGVPIKPYGRQGHGAHIGVSAAAVVRRRQEAAERRSSDD